MKRRIERMMERDSKKRVVKRSKKRTECLEGWERGRRCKSIGEMCSIGVFVPACVYVCKEFEWNHAQLIKLLNQPRLEELYPLI